MATADRLANVVRPDLHRQRADRAAAGQRLMFQPGMDGTGTAFAAMDAETFATVHQAIETLTHDAAGRRVASNVEALRALARQRLARTGTSAGAHEDDSDPAFDRAGDDPTAADASSEDVVDPDPTDTGGAPSTARPEMLIITDVSLLAGSADDDAPGDRSRRTSDARRPRQVTRYAGDVAELLWRTNRPTPTLTPDAVRRMACDATLRPILADGHRILGAAEPHARVSTSLRAALVARDGGCRFPACHRSADVCDAHHVVHKVDNGPTVLENLSLLCTTRHRAVHEGGWHTELHADGLMTFARRGVRLCSVPRRATIPEPDRPPPGGRPPRRPARATISAPVEGPPSITHDGDHQTTGDPRCGAPPDRVTTGDTTSAAELPF